MCVCVLCYLSIDFLVIQQSLSECDFLLLDWDNDLFGHTGHLMALLDLLIPIGTQFDSQSSLERTVRIGYESRPCHLKSGDAIAIHDTTGIITHMIRSVPPEVHSSSQMKNPDKPNRSKYGDVRSINERGNVFGNIDLSYASSFVNHVKTIQTNDKVIKKLVSRKFRD